MSDIFQYSKLESKNETSDKIKLLKMHAQNKLCKLWSEATQVREKRLVIIKLNRDLLTDFLKNTQLKVLLEERMEMLAMMSLLMDTTISNEEKTRFLNGSRVSSPTVKIFKDCIINNLKKQVEKIEILQVIKNVLNYIAKENGILGGYLLPPSFITKSVNETLAKGVKTVSNNVNTVKDIAKEIKNQNINTSPKKEQILQKNEKIVEKYTTKHEKQSLQNSERYKPNSEKKEIIRAKKSWREKVLNKQKMFSDQEISR
ncbi:MAG: hypothetical protein PHY80_00675 [Rickettsiales bacterium]|nr:hypothetical protein [Rickettsiales bacterium]